METEGVGLTELLNAENRMRDQSIEQLETTALLWSEVEVLYITLLTLIKAPTKEEEQFSILLACNLLQICRVLLIKGVLAAFRLYWADSLTHQRKAIELGAVAVRLIKHKELCKVWAEAGIGKAENYDAYRKAFATGKLFPQPGQPDHDRILTQLKTEFDRCSKTLHGNVFGVMTHFIPGNAQKGVHMFDLPRNLLVPSYLSTVDTHLLIVYLLGQTLQPYTENFDSWKKQCLEVQGNVVGHCKKWNIQ